MAYSLNRAQIIGNVTRDPETRMAGGQPVATFAVATNFSWTDSTGQKKDKAEFHNIVVWRKLAEIAQNYVKKGGKIFVEGKMQTREWEGEDGVKRYKTEIVADNLILLDGKKGDGAPMGSGMNHETSEGGFTPFSGGARGPRSVKKNTDEGEMPAEMGAGQVSAPEVSIDDLPF